MPLATDAQTISALSAGGLILDIGGAIILAIGLIGKKQSAMIRESQSPYGGSANPLLILAMVRQRVDAQVGVTLLVLGFVCQMDSPLGWQPPWARLWPVLAVSTGILLTTAVLWPYWWAPRQLKRAAGAGARFAWMQNERYNAAQGQENDREVWLELLKPWAEGLAERRENEPVEAFARRAFGKRYWSKLEPYLTTLSMREGGTLLRARGEHVSQLPLDESAK
jgi:hypothetical protein